MCCKELYNLTAQNSVSVFAAHWLWKRRKIVRKGSLCNSWRCFSKVFSPKEVAPKKSGLSTCTQKRQRGKGFSSCLDTQREDLDPKLYFKMYSLNVPVDENLKILLKKMRNFFGECCRCIYFRRQNLVCILLQGVHSVLAPLMHFRASNNEQGCTFCVPIGKKSRSKSA